MIKGRVAILWLLMFMVAAALLEAVSYVTLHVAEAIRPGVVLELFMDQHFAAISPEIARKFRDGLYHPDLGWDYEPLSHYAGINSAGDPYRMSWDASGARDDGFFDYELFMATYGDSFTVGEEVNNDETWQYFLSKSIGKRVVNFGTSGYGTDQALLKFKHHLGKYEVAPFTVLVILEENIRRNINLFRPFYRAEDGLALGFKPKFICSSTLVIQPNPLVPFNDDILQLRQLAEKLVSDDGYARRKIRLQFPYSLRVVQLLIEFVPLKFGYGSWLFPGSLDLWAEPDAVQLMQCIVDEFINLCREHHSIPIILFIPAAGHEDNAPYDPFVRQLKIRHPDVIVVDMAAQVFDVGRFRVTPREHTSAYGNQIIAEALREAVGL